MATLIHTTSGRGLDNSAAALVFLGMFTPCWRSSEDVSGLVLLEVPSAESHCLFGRTDSI